MADDEFSSEEQAAIQEIENGSTAEPVQDAEPPAQDTAADDMAPADDRTPEETAKDGDGQGEDQKKGDPAVALQQARQQARESREAQRKLEAALEQQRKNYEALAERIGSIAQGRQPVQPQRPADDPAALLNQPFMDEPDPFDDPEGFKAAKEHNKRLHDAQQRVIRDMFAERQRTTQATEQQRRQAQAMQQLDQVGLQHKQDFMIEAPDYEEAEAFALNSKAEEYRAFGMNDQQIAQQIRNDVFAITQQAQRLGQNAAQMIYQFAKVRGWQPGVQAGGQPQNDNAAMIAQKAAAAQKNRSIGAVAGARPSHGITPEKLMSLSDDDIANFDEDELLKAIGVA